MAIKERKQLTGTTAKIMQYAGHEGQLVFDKEQKRLHVMSGVVGQTTPLAKTDDLAPLATKAEVLTHSAQTLTPEQKAQVVKNLEGTFLPLVGGTVTGSITTSSARILKKHTDTSEMVVCGGTDINNGGWLGLFGQNYNDGRKGGFTLVATDKTLMGTPSGELSWGGKEVVRVESFEDFSNHPSGNSWQHCIRFSNGLQVSYGMYAQEPPPTLGATVTFVLPFIHVPSITLSCFGPDYSGKDLSVHLTNPLNTGFKFWSTWNNWHYWQAFGKWK